MRLLQIHDDGDLSLTKDLIGNVPPYGILSHTWGSDEEEITFQDLQIQNGSWREKLAFRKIQFCARQAKRDGLQYCWIDTCCIDKSNNSELSEAIISMFRWYRNAIRCYVYLIDVVDDDQDLNNPVLSFNRIEPMFKKSRWFTRGWTLQELVAPPIVEFYSREGKLLGDKKSLERQICGITGVSVNALRGHALSSFTVAERLSWAEYRETKREEDQAYSLFGLFGVYMPPLYGEGYENAFRRLRTEIDKGSDGAPYSR